MKKSLLSLSFLGLTALFFGCSDDITAPGDSPIAENSSSSIATDLSSSGAQPGNISSSTIVIGRKDTVEKHETVTIPGSKIPYPDIVTEPVVCIWTPNCAVEPPSSSSKATPKSSSSQGGISIDLPENKPPVVNGTTMTDQRDNKTYKLMQIGGKLWMAQDINYEVANSECYNEQNENCATNGRLYTFNAAQRACPTGWRLPNREETKAALNDESVPWSYSGRCKDGTCDFLGDMGFHWTSGDPQPNDKKYDENGGSNGALIIVEKSPDYVKEGDDQKFFQVDQKTKRFSVRCVQD